MKIYEYSAGFLHSKVFLADDEVGVVGTVNLDYRSLLFHFEDAVLLFGTPSLNEIKTDMAQLFAVSRLQTEQDAKKRFLWRWICEIAKLFAPLF